jgi:hypothetical protein
MSAELAGEWLEEKQVKPLNILTYILCELQVLSPHVANLSKRCEVVRIYLEYRNSAILLGIKCYTPLMKIPLYLVSCHGVPVCKPHPDPHSSGVVVGRDLDLKLAVVERRAEVGDVAIYVKSCTINK